MINPQMMGMNLDNIPKPSDLWKQEKYKYRHWIILFGIGILLILSFHLAASILNFLDKTSILTQIKQSLDPKTTNLDQVANMIWTSNYIAFPTIIFALLFIGLILYIITVTKSYLEKSFARISLWSVSVIGFGALISFVQLISIIAWRNFQFLNIGPLFAFINNILFIAIYLTSGTRVNRIRKQFAYSEYVEKLRKDERFIQWQNHLQNAVQNQTSSGNAFAPIPPSSSISEVVNPAGASSPTITPPIDLKLQEQYAKLKAMSLSKLRIVAKKLSISGFELMKKDELIETIMRVSSDKK